MLAFKMEARVERPHATASSVSSDPDLVHAFVGEGLYRCCWQGLSGDISPPARDKQVIPKAVSENGDEDISKYRCRPRQVCQVLGHRHLSSVRRVFHKTSGALHCTQMAAWAFTAAYGKLSRMLVIAELSIDSSTLRMAANVLSHWRFPLGIIAKPWLQE